jgi:hypothetical protein
LRLALDTLHDAADLLALVKAGEVQDRDVVAAYAGIRAARKAAGDLVSGLTGAAPKRGPGRPAHASSRRERRFVLFLRRRCPTRAGASVTTS